jgi:Tol biopolymer transport system component
MSKKSWLVLLGLLLATTTACREHSPEITVVSQHSTSEHFQKIAYHTLENELGLIYLLDLESRDQIRLTASKEGVMPFFSFSPDGQKLVYVADSKFKPPDIYVMNLDGTDKKRLTRTNALEVEPLWSPDGKRIAFVSAHEDRVEKVFTVRPDGGKVQRLTKEIGITTSQPSWSPDGTKIACTSATQEMVVARIRDIRIVEVETGESLQLISNGFNNHTPQWSPDGLRLAYISNKHGAYDVYVLDLTSETERKLTNLNLDILRIAWSPLGDRITFAVQIAEYFEIGVVMSDGSDLTLLTFTSANDAWGNWSPDGSQIAFFSDRDGEQAALYIMNPDGSDQTRIQTKTSRVISPPVWLPHPGAARATVAPTLQASPTPAPTLLPQSQRIAFVSGQDDKAEVYVLDLSTRQVTQLTHNVVPDVWPRWSTDGRRILFMCFANDNWDLCIINADGTNLRRLTDTRNRDELLPAWSFGGHWVVYTEYKKGETYGFGAVFGLSVIDVDTRIPRQVPLLSEIMPPEALFWMPDDSEIVYLTNEMEGRYAVKAVNLKEGQTRVLLDGLKSPYPKAFPSPDRTELLYITQDKELHNLHIFDVKTGETVSDISLKDGISSINWSPDGQVIALVLAQNEGKSAIFVIDSDGQNMRKLVDTPGKAFSPVWSPSGDQIAFISMDGDRPDLWGVNADGSGLTKLVENVNQFEWSP